LISSVTDFIPIQEVKTPTRKLVEVITLGPKQGTCATYFSANAREDLSCGLIESSKDCQEASEMLNLDKKITDLNNPQGNLPTNCFARQNFGGPMFVTWNPNHPAHERPAHKNKRGRKGGEKLLCGCYKSFEPVVPQARSVSVEGAACECGKNDAGKRSIAYKRKCGCADEAVQCRSGTSWNEFQMAYARAVGHKTYAKERSEAYKRWKAKCAISAEPELPKACPPEATFGSCVDSSGKPAPPECCQEVMPKDVPVVDPVKLEEPIINPVSVDLPDVMVEERVGNKNDEDLLEEDSDLEGELVEEELEDEIDNEVIAKVEKVPATAVKAVHECKKFKEGADIAQCVCGFGNGPDVGKKCQSLIMQALMMTGGWGCALTKTGGDQERCVPMAPFRSSTWQKKIV